jgi:RNA polymerase sigma-54 factor
MSSQGSSLRITQNQRLALTEALLRSLELLQLPAAELEETIQAELQANPLLEREDEGPEASAASAEKESAPALEAAPFDEPVGVTPIEREPSALNWTSTSHSIDDDAPEAYETVAAAESLREFLEKELSLQTGVSERQRLLIIWLIGNLSDNGLFDESLEAVAESCPVLADQAEWNEALKRLQLLAPAGIGARNKTEMLMLQLDRMQPQDETAAIARRMLSECPDLLMKRDFRTIARSIGSDHALCERAFALIGTLDPHPAARFASPETEGFVIPEVIVSKTTSGALLVTLNPACTPRLRFNQEYFELLNASRLSAESLAQWREKAQSARSFAHAVEQRAATLLTVARTIAQEQKEFFRLGDGALRPMTLKDIAEILKISVSTVSRITSGKYMQTPRGTFELKHFFSSSLPAAADGQAVSSLVARERIRSLVHAEDPAHPLSDAAIAEALSAEGIALARRTVAKYRELEGIAPRSERKRPV